MEISETEYSAFLFEQKKKLEEKNPASIAPTGYANLADESVDNGQNTGYSIQ